MPKIETYLEDEPASFARSDVSARRRVGRLPRYRDILPALSRDMLSFHHHPCTESSPFYCHHVTESHVYYSHRMPKYIHTNGMIQYIPIIKLCIGLLAYLHLQRGRNL